ncbi:hypothetical protein GLP25_08355 [Photobacterium phosphoreum]|uniref:hypothetical protein n=1 Tax=Photobacterium phosphoreum TaxID=659 RepID=UPI001E5EC6F3|nr:hypothetical protein [Photobacterium phosphoreum]MCD9483201.1 hypothetical protein [Photobacterium phosphoreum]
MSKPIEQLVEIVSAGGNVIVGSKPVEQLIVLVTAAAKTNAQVTIKASKSVEQLVSIAKAGNGNVTFDLTD